MSKNIVIQEGGVGRQFTAEKLITPLVSGGSCNWVPEDEIQLSTKYISENGTYIAANDGEYGYSQVNVNVSSTTKIITGSTDDGEPVVTTINAVNETISEIILGDYFIVTYDDGEVAKIEDNNGNRCLLTYDGETLSGFDDIEDNHYIIILDSNGNISQVIDPNAQECELRDSDNDGKIDIISIGEVMRVIPDIETGDIKIIDENDNDVTDNYIGTSITGIDNTDTPWRANIVNDVDTGGASVGITPVNPAITPGASISGLDSDGDKSIASINDNGEIVQKKIPSAISIDTEPTKKEYTDGETINYSGLVVKAMLESGNPFTDERYPAGIIPHGELDLPVTVADITQAQQVIYTDGMGIMAQQCNFDIPARFFNNDPFMCSMPTGTIEVNGITYPMFYAVPGTVARNGFATKYDGRLFIMTLTGNSQHAFGYVKDGSYRGKGFSSGPITTVFNDVTYGAGCGDFVSAVSEVNPRNRGFENRTSVGGGQSIPVKWTSPYDGKTLETSFVIIVTQNSEGGDNPGGGDTSPVPEGITVQDINIAIYNAMNAGQDHIEIDGQQYTLAEAQAMIDYLINN